MWPQTGEIGPRCVLLPTNNQPCGRPKMSMNTSLLISLVIPYTLHPVHSKGWTAHKTVGGVCVCNCKNLTALHTQECCIQSGRPLASRFTCRAAESGGWNHQTVGSSLPFPRSEDGHTKRNRTWLLSLTFHMTLIRLCLYKEKL